MAKNIIKKVLLPLFSLFSGTTSAASRLQSKLGPSAPIVTVESPEEQSYQFRLG